MSPSTVRKPENPSTDVAPTRTIPPRSSNGTLAESDDGSAAWKRLMPLPRSPWKDVGVLVSRTCFAGKVKVQITVSMPSILAAAVAWHQKVLVLVDPPPLPSWSRHRQPICQLNEMKCGIPPPLPRGVGFPEEKGKARLPHEPQQENPCCASRLTTPPCANLAED